MKKPLNESQENGLTIKIQEPKKNFIILYDSVYKNNDLTTDEIALIVKLLSCAPTFKPTKKKLSNVLNIDERRLTKASKGLQKKGYLKVKKYSNTSEWIINQEPFIADLEEITTPILLKMLLSYKIRLEDLKTLRKLKYIDDKILTETTEQYIKEIKRIMATPWLDDEE